MKIFQGKLRSFFFKMSLSKKHENCEIIENLPENHLSAEYLLGKYNLPLSGNKSKMKDAAKANGVTFSPIVWKCFFDEDGLYGSKEIPLKEAKDGVHKSHVRLCSHFI